MNDDYKEDELGYDAEESVIPDKREDRRRQRDVRRQVEERVEQRRLQRELDGYWD